MFSCFFIYNLHSINDLTTVLVFKASKDLETHFIACHLVGVLKFPDFVLVNSRTYENTP